MKKKKLFLLFTIFKFIIIDALSSNVKKNSLTKNMKLNENILNEKNEIHLDLDSNRILQILEIFYFLEQHNSILDLYQSSQSLLKNFFGISIKDIKYNNDSEKQLLIEKIIIMVNTFNEQASLDLKYLCDMQIQYILSLKIIILNKIKKKSIYSLILLSYYYYLFSPNEYISSNTQNETDQIEEEINWQEAALQVPLEFAELGMLYNGYLYELYNTVFTSKLSLNKEYNNVLLTKKNLPDVIANDNNSIERLFNEYKKNLNFFKSDSDYIQLYTEKQEFFLMWLLDKKNIINTLENFINDDSLFFLFITVLLYKSILKININDYYPLLNDQLIMQFESAAKQAEFIIYKFFSIFDKKLHIKWDKLPIIIINQNRLIDIIQYLTVLTIL